jgi:hypothetical protein
VRGRRRRARPGADGVGNEEQRAEPERLGAEQALRPELRQKLSEVTVRNTVRLPRVTATGWSVPRLNRITGGPLSPVDPPSRPASAATVPRAPQPLPARMRQPPTSAASVTSTTTETAVRIASAGSAPSAQTPGGVKTIAIAIMMVTARRSAARQAPGTTVTREASAESEKAAMATGAGRIAAPTGMKMSADPKPAKP